MMKPKSRFVLITGASTGIGYGAAKELIRRGYTVFGSVRKTEDAERVKSELGAGFLPLLFDVTDAAALGRAVIEVEERCKGQGLGGLINNAGVAVLGPIELLSVEEIARNFEVNVFGLLRVTKAFLPLLGAEKDRLSEPGRILNMSSTAGRLSAPYTAAYAGAKHALEGISHAMRMEFRRYGIEVIVLGPGIIDTPIWGKGALDRFDGSSYHDSLAGFFGKVLSGAKEVAMPVEECSRRIADIFESAKPKIRYAIVRNRFLEWTLPTLLPQRALDRYFRRLM